MADVMGTYLSKSEKSTGIPGEDEHVADTLNDAQLTQNSQNSEHELSDDDVSTETRRQENERKLEVFKEELAAKREARRKAIAAAAEKLASLQQQLDAEQQARINAEQEAARLKERLSDERLKDELEQQRNKISFLEKELEREKRWRLEFEEEREKREEAEQQAHALKELTSIGKEMLRIRELEVNELRKRLCEAQYPQDLREEYEAQIDNVKRLRSLYEERLEAVRFEQQQEIDQEMSTMRTLECKVRELEQERQEAELMKEHLKDRVLKLDRELEERNDAANALQEQLDASITECRDLTSQVNSVSNLFAQILAGNSCSSDVVTTESVDAVVTGEGDVTVDGEETGVPVQEKRLNAVQAEKIWEMLVKHTTQDVSSTGEAAASSESCYKSVDTPSGKRSVISVSQTFLTLKNLILEKKALVKEVNNLKVLNEHLETRLGNQERRLTTVSSELKKTWGVVNKLRVQHKQLHTQEKILRYELQHKRLLLTDLKDELERCKEIWDMARQKNCQSELEWRKLRKEFADRRTHQHINNSAESGYEDEENTSNSPPTEENTDSEPHSNQTDVLTPDYIDSENDEASLPLRTDDITSDNEEFPKCSITTETKTEDTDERLCQKPSPELLSDTSDVVPTRKDESAENVSKFLEGLIVVNDNEPSETTTEHPENILTAVHEHRKEDNSCESSNRTNISLVDKPCDGSNSNSCHNNTTESVDVCNPVLPISESISCTVGNVVTSTSDGGECSRSSIVGRTAEQVLDARTERLKRLEEQCKLLFTKVTATTIKSNVLSSKLELLHEQYGRSEEDTAESQAEAYCTKSCDTKVDKMTDDESES